MKYTLSVGCLWMLALDFGLTVLHYVCAWCSDQSRCGVQDKTLLSEGNVESLHQWQGQVRFRFSGVPASM